MRARTLISDVFIGFWGRKEEAAMLSDTLIGALEPYSIGAKLRALRLKKSMGLVELGRHTGLSAALLSKLERSKLYPTLSDAADVAADRVGIWRWVGILLHR
jgi:hypothetical protein